MSQPETDAFNNLKSKEKPATVGTPAVPSGPLEAGWYKGLLEVSKLHTKQEEEMRKLFQLVLSGIFGKSQQVIDSFCNIGTSAPKRLAFIQVFLPYLRKELTKRLIIDELSNAIGLDKTITQTLAVNILKNGAIPLYDSLAAIKDVHFQNVTEGYLIPVAGGDYTFVIKDNNILLKLNEDKITFTAPVDINGEWWSDKQELRAGYLYKLAMTDTRAIQPVPSLTLKDVFWKTPLTKPASIPTLELLPHEAYDNCSAAFTALKKVALLINAFKLSAEELDYFQLHSTDFDSLDFNNVGLIPFLRIADYCSLRNSLPQPRTNILDFWKWINDTVSDLTKLSEKIAELTTWKKERIDTLIATNHFNIGKLEDYRNEKNLLKLQEALTVAAKTGMDIDKLFEWAKPISDFGTCKTIADSIQKTIRAQYNQTDWEQVVKPLNDQLRNNQKNALIVYLLQQKEVKDAHVTDADGLFEYFLIDVQMDTCMETSRIKQVISSVQLFIQRCFIGLEKDNGIAPSLLDRKRWEWMERYRVWEANRKVYLYPENWTESNLRDDKSPFFKELESELLQKDINKQNVTDALKTYLYKVDEVANMEVVGLYIEGEKTDDFTWGKGAKLHVFSRTRNAPYFFYYRYLALDEMNWYPWEKMQVDIPSYDVEEVTEVIKVGNTYKLNPKYKTIIGNGCYLTPIVWNKRLLIFFPQFMRKTKPNEDVAGSKSIRDISEDSTDSSKPIEYWEIKMAWSECRNGKWTQKQLSKDAIYDIPGVDDFWKVFNAASKVMARSVAAQREYEIKNRAAWRRRDKWALKSQERKNLETTAATDAEWAAWEQLVTDEQLAWDDYKVAWDKEIEAKANADDAAAEIVVNIAVAQLKTLLPPPPASDISNYKFVPVILTTTTNLLSIEVYYDQRECGAFGFDGSNIITESPDGSRTNSTNVDRFHHSSSYIYSLQKSNGLNQHGFWDRTVTKYLTPYGFFNFHHSDAHKLLGIINAQPLESFFKFPIGGIAHNPDKDDVFGGYDHDANTLSPKIYHELKRPYSLYNWELFFHTPIMIADALSKAQQFEKAMKWFHYVFNPIADGEDDKRFWQFAPFKEINSKSILEQIFNNLKGNEPNAVISEWRNNPFKPHLVARSRPVAYMKWVVMKYIDNILDWGDYLFRQDTIESINQATQLYVLAGHILGSKPMMIPKRSDIKPQTYLSLLDKWDAFSNAMSELEVATIYSIQPAKNITINKEEIPTANFFGSASALYFCIPKNPKLMGYWDTLADRLFKIRHCQNIEGVFRKLPLFEPPIDPALLVKAAAQGLSISSVVNDLNTAMPNYRFYYLLQKALELCNELKSLGGAMLSAIEKKDNEAMSLIRARHEGTMNNLMMEIKKLQLEESQKSLESLQQNRKAPEARMTYYLQLAGEDSNKLPTTDSDFAELANSIEKPIDESGLKLSKFEKEDMDKSSEARTIQIEVGQKELLASILHLLPTASVDGKPFGIGLGVQFGGPMLGGAMQAWAKSLQNDANGKSYVASIAAKKGGFQRALQERIMQANAAGYELKQIDKQITAQQIRINITNQEILNQQKQIENANEAEEFLKNKYTNEELYIWMRGSLKTLYHQVYNLAYDLAKKAERTYCFERGVSNADFIQSGYFDAGREGLLAGEQLYVGLKQLEAAYQEKRGYDYEITKHISLRQIDPLALLQLKAASTCEFDLPEVLFDMDYPGHFKRRIKSVSVSIPCIAGPYTGVNATLRLLNNKFRNSSIANNYPEKTDEQDDRFISYNIPITAIATSSAQNDAGMFELNFKDERYLPFEGAGVISKWRLELPTVKQFDYNTISDVVLHVKYIASEGGEQLKNSATGSISVQLNQISQQLNETGLHIPISLKHDMPNEWNLLVKNGSANITIDKSRLPYMAQILDAAAIENVMLIARVKNNLPSYSINIGGSATNLSRIDEWKLCMGNNSNIELDTSFELSVVPAELVGDLEELMLVVKYIIP